MNVFAFSDFFQKQKRSFENQRKNVPLNIIENTPLAERIRQSTHNRFKIGSIPIRCRFFLLKIQAKTSVSFFLQFSNLFPLWYVWNHSISPQKLKKPSKCTPNFFKKFSEDFLFLQFSQSWFFSRKMLNYFISPEFYLKRKNIMSGLLRSSINFFFLKKILGWNGTSPSGKAAVFGTDIRRFESFRPSSRRLLFFRFFSRKKISFLRVLFFEKFLPSLFFSMEKRSKSYEKIHNFFFLEFTTLLFGEKFIEKFLFFFLFFWKYFNRSNHTSRKKRPAKNWNTFFCKKKNCSWVF